MHPSRWSELPGAPAVPPLRNLAVTGSFNVFDSLQNRTEYYESINNVTDSRGDYVLKVYPPSGAFMPATLGLAFSGAAYYSANVTVSAGSTVRKDVSIALPNLRSVSGTAFGQVAPQLLGAERFHDLGLKLFGTDFRLRILTDSKLKSLNFSQSDKSISVAVDGPPFTRGDLSFTVPKSLLHGPWVVNLDGAMITPQVLTDNSSTTVLKVSYAQGAHIIIFEGAYAAPEFPPEDLAILVVVPLVVAALFLRLRARRPMLPAAAHFTVS